MNKQFWLAAAAIGIALALGAQAAKAQEPKPKKLAMQFYVNGTEVTKLQAIRSLIQDSNAKVMQCAEITLTPDAKVVRK